MKIRSIELLDSLSADVRQMLVTVTQLKSLDAAVLRHEPGEGRWSVAQVLAHLNSYGKYYLPEIQKSLDNSSLAATEFFSPGWAGEYFTKIMRPGINGVIKNKMKSPKGHRPMPIADVDGVIDIFIDQQYWLLELIEQARKKAIGKIRTPISISRFIKLKTGDTFRFLIAHEQRHFVQIENVINEIQAVKDRFPADRQVV
jgi:hypothetical protein